MFQPVMPQITVKELAQLLAEPASTRQLVDVREPSELAIASIEGFQNLPLSEFATWSDNISAKLDPNQATFVLCHHGMRSAQMCQWLINQGFSQVKNIAGGIDAYSTEIDAAIPRY